jgi:TonB-linked SusC/RagA family outer membrane protein
MGGGGKQLLITLLEDSRALEEVVVVAYGTQKKATLTGSISNITTTDLKQSPTANLTNALAGRLPGLITTQFGGGETGADFSEIIIRGLSTYGDRSPIVIVDGVERDMRYWSAEEIESFTILKDASSTAAYGVRGANGVIIINTKRGKNQEKVNISLKMAAGSMQQIRFPEFLGSADYAMLYNEARINEGLPPDSRELFSQEAINNFRIAKGDNSDRLGYNWDYFDYAFKPGNRQEYSLSLRGGTERARYYVMAGYYNENGNYKHVDLTQYDAQAVLKRYNFRTNVDIDINKNFYARLDLGALLADHTSPGTNGDKIMSLCYTQPPYLPIVLPENGNPQNEEFVQRNPYGLLYGDYLHRRNILGELSRTGYIQDKRTYVTSTFALGHRLDFITEGLKIEASFSYDANEQSAVDRQIPGYDEGYRHFGGYATFRPGSGDFGTYYITNGPNYDGVYVLGNRDLSEDRTMSNGYGSWASESKVYYQLKLDYDHSFDQHQVTGLLLFNRSSRVNFNQVPYRYQGIAGRLTYNYVSRYLAELNMGYNGSENFAKGKRYGFFPAASIGWILSNESFMSETKDWLSMMKLRASLGFVGSDKLATGRFSYLQFFNYNYSYYFGENDFSNAAAQGITEGNFANPDLTWEKARKLNVGLDVSAFNGNLTLAADYFFEHRYDIITSLGANNVGFPAYVGKSAPMINSGIVDNQGVDFEIGWRQRIGNDFVFYVKPNFTFARNKIVFMNEISRDFEWRKYTGKPVGEHLVFIVDHLVYDQAEADRLNAMNNGDGFQPWGALYPGDAVYRDLDGDGKITDLNDRTGMGYPRIPEIQFGIPAGIQYRGLDFSIMFQGSARTSVALTGRAAADFPLFEDDQVGKVKPMHMERWTEATRDMATYPRLTVGRNDNNKNVNSSLFLYDAKYLRLKNLEIGYTLPKRYIRFAGLQNIRIYAQGMNLLTFDGLDKVGVDPEHREGETWYPIQRTFNFGIDITY